VAKRGGSPTVIDGFASVRAAKHAGLGAKGPKLRKSSTRLPAPAKGAGKKKPAGGKRASRIGHTVVPDRNEIVCHECGYDFVLQGKIDKTYCPKCRSLLQMTHHVVDGKHTGMVRTIGSVEIKSKAEIGSNTEFIAGTIKVGGDARQARLQAHVLLEVRRGGRVDVTKTRIKDLRVAKSGRLTTASRVTCRNVEVLGNLKAKLYAEGIVTVKPGGTLAGEVHGAHLVVEEGGGLTAKVFVAAD